MTNQGHTPEPTPSPASAREEAAQQTQDAARDARRHLLVASGPRLRDLEKAVDCHCSCHPRPAEVDLHEGGVVCPCQFTPKERRRAWEKLFAASAELGEFEDLERAEFDQTRDELGTPDVEIRVGACPLVIAGSIDGCEFYLRERHGSWCLVIPAETDATETGTKVDGTEVDGTEAKRDDVEAGDRPHLWDAPDRPEHILVTGQGTPTAAEALRIAARELRIHLRRSACPHLDARAFCPDCGAATG